MDYHPVNWTSAYKRKGAQEIVMAQSALATTRYKGIASGPLRDHVNLMKSHIDTLLDAGAPMPDFAIKKQLLSSLPLEFAIQRW